MWFSIFDPADNLVPDLRGRDPFMKDDAIGDSCGNFLADSGISHRVEDLLRLEFLFLS